jgi:hypothetical protein
VTEAIASDNHIQSCIANPRQYCHRHLDRWPLDSGPLIAMVELTADPEGKKLRPASRCTKLKGVFPTFRPADLNPSRAAR